MYAFINVECLYMYSYYISLCKYKYNNYRLFLISFINIFLVKYFFFNLPPLLKLTNLEKLWDSEMLFPRFRKNVCGRNHYPSLLLNNAYGIYYDTMCRCNEVNA